METDNHDAELLAIWLHSAARAAGHLELIRNVIRQAANEATGMYCITDDPLAEEDEDNDMFGVRDVIVRFAAKWDECERGARNDDKK